VFWKIAEQIYQPLTAKTKAAILILYLPETLPFTTCYHWQKEKAGKTQPCITRC